MMKNWHHPAAFHRRLLRRAVVSCLDEALQYYLVLQSGNAILILDLKSIHLKIHTRGLSQQLLSNLLSRYTLLILLRMLLTTDKQFLVKAIA